MVRNFHCDLLQDTGRHVGITRVRHLGEPFSCLFAGADGVLGLLHWNTEGTHYMDNTKSDIMCLETTEHFIVAGCADGSLKIVQYKACSEWYNSRALSTVVNSLTGAAPI